MASVSGSKQDSLRKVPFWRPRRLGHANLYVTDLERSMGFYNTVVGLEESYRRPSIKAGFLGNGNTHHDIGMVEVSSPLSRSGEAGLNHLAFELENEVDLVAGYQRAVAAEIDFPRTVDHDITRSIYGLDPDGNTVEIYADMTTEWRKLRTGVVTKPTPQWTPGTPPPGVASLYQENPEIRRVAAAIFHPTRITHVVLVARDYVGMLGYYRDRIGLELLCGDADSRFAVLGGTNGSRDLCLFRRREGWCAGLHHIGFAMRDADDLAASVGRLVGTSWELEREIDRPVRYCVHIKDPDGLRIQFYIDREDPLDALSSMDTETALFLA